MIPTIQLKRTKIENRYKKAESKKKKAFAWVW